MKYYLIDEISDQDMERLSLFLNNNATMSGLDKISWINVSEEFLNDTQSGHVSCQPYFFAVELDAGMIKAEFFIRSLKNMRCTCSSYSDERQSQFIIRFVDDMIGKLDIKT